MSGVDVDILSILSSKMGFDFHLHLEGDYLVLGKDGIVSGGVYHSVSTLSNKSEIGIGSCIPDAGNLSFAYKTRLNGFHFRK